MTYSPLELFPTPIRAPGPLAEPSSTVALIKALNENHNNWHIFFNDIRFHNHIPHHILALWSLGASAEQIEHAYEHGKTYQRPRFDSPHIVTEHNFEDYLGDENYYDAYFKFFTQQVSKLGVPGTLERYLFPAEDTSEMLNRIFDGVMHPFIFTGSGLEFGLPGLVICGLATTAVHVPSARQLFTAPPVPTILSAFEILARVKRDPLCRIAKPESEFDWYSDATSICGERIARHVAEWDVGRDIQRAVEEMEWMCVILFGVGATNKHGEFKADFFLMHLVTSSLFLRPFTSSLTSLKSKTKLLRAYYSVALIWWIASGRPWTSLDFSEVYRSTSDESPFDDIVESTFDHPDDHLPKFQRALMHYDELYIGPPQWLKEKSGLDGEEYLDGTLFRRISRLTDGRLGHKWEGGAAENVHEEISVWDRDGFYDE